MLKYRRLPVALVAACLAVGMVAAPSATAASPGKKGARAHAAQAKKKPITAAAVNKRLNATRKSLSSTRKSLSRTQKTLKTTSGQVDKAMKDLGSLSARLGNAEGGLSTLMGAAPTLVSGLTQLSDAVQKQIAPGLKSLSEAVQGTIAPGLQQTAAGLQTLAGTVQNTIAPGLQQTAAGLQTLSGTVQNTIAPGLTAVSGAVNDPNTGLAAVNQRQATSEFGVARVYKLDEGTGTPESLGTVWTGDIPDDGNNAAMASGSAVDQSCDGGDVYVVRAEIRTSEADGASTPAGSAGASLIVTSGDGPLLVGGVTDPGPTPPYAGVDAVDVTGAPKSSNGPTATGAGGTELVRVTVPPAAPAGTCLIQGSAQFFDFQENSGSAVD